MKALPILFSIMATLALFAFHPVLYAEVYKWVDEDGRVHYGDRPASKSATQMDIKNQPAPTASEGDWQTIKQRQQKYLEYLEDERKDRDEVKAKQAAEKAERQKLCDEATQYHQRLMTNRLFYREDEDGNKVYLDYKEKDEEIRKTKEMMDKYCIS